METNKVAIITFGESESEIINDVRDYLSCGIDPFLDKEFRVYVTVEEVPK